MRVHRFNSPLQHWFSGLLVEVAALVAFVGSLFFVVLLVVWLR